MILLLALLGLQACLAFQLSPTLSRTPTFLHALSRRDYLVSSAFVLLLPLPSAQAASTTSSSPFDSIRYELYDSKGGVAYMKSLVEKKDYTSLLDFTKTYDQTLRKRYMGAAKKLLPKEYSEQATLINNAVTFDLIGINRSARVGQENQEQCFKYLRELQADVEKLLALEEKEVASVE